MAFTKDRVNQHLRPSKDIKTDNVVKPFQPSKNLADEWPEVFSKIMMERFPTGKWDKGPEQEEVIIFNDPRPDLDMNDNSYWWAWLLADAWQADHDLAITLHGFRCQGTMLETNPNGGMKLIPKVGEQGWASPEEYQAAREKYLVPKRDKLGALLKSLH